MKDVSESLNIEGWMTEEELTFLAEAASASHLIVEVGSWKGRTTTVLSRYCKGTVFAVDVWGDGITFNPNRKLSEGTFNDFSQNIRVCNNVIPIPLTSIRAASVFVQLDWKFDMIFIDADHEYESVWADLKAWMPLLADGGILCGHDYTAPPHPGVKQAVDELVGEVKIIDTIWCKV